MAFDSLPFGWNLSPIIAQESLGVLLDTFVLSHGLLLFVGCSLLFFRYLDDILILSPNPALYNWTLALCAFLRSNNLIISPKSNIIPSTKFVWLGKSFDLYSRSILPTPESITRCLGVALLAGLLLYIPPWWLE